MFDNFISLGFFCGVASSLSKYGFRSKSYPFDWYHSNFKSVIHFIDTDFSDFLLKENLKVVPEKWPRFDDVKYDLRFSHDLKDENNFDLEYPDIYEKYARRIERFRIDIQNPTCFLRAVWTEDELRYIMNNQSYIEQVIKRSNASNEIIILIPPSLKIKGKLSLLFFTFNERWGSDTPTELRSMFDSNSDLICYLQNNTSVSNIASNLMWDREAELNRMREEQRGYFYTQTKILQSRYSLAIDLLNKELDKACIPSSIVIYGAGNIGKALFNKCNELCHVEYFIDNNSQETEYKGVPIIPLDKVEKQAYSFTKNYVITPIYDLDTIRMWFSEHYPGAILIPVDKLFVKS